MLFEHVTINIILMRQFMYFYAKASKSGVYFTFATNLNSDKLNFKCSIVTCI